MDNKMTVINRIINYINKNIDSGAWPVGQKIPSENSLCETLSVSRVSVRSALQQYIALGILKSYHGKGTYVLKDDLSIFGLGKTSRDSIYDMEQVLEFRSMIEPEIAANAAKNATPEIVQELQELLNKMRDSIGDNTSFVRYDMIFHEILCKATKNVVLQDVMSDIFQKKQEIHLKLNEAVGYYGGMYYHVLLLKAIQEHDAKHAKMLMYEHLQMSLDELALENDEMKDAGK